MKYIDMTGRVFGKITVIGQDERGHRDRILWRYRCSCGNEGRANGYDIRHGHTKSCGKCNHNVYRQINDCGITLVKLSNGTEFAIDSNVEALIKPYQWSVGGNGYVVTNINGKRVFLHKMVIGIDDKSIVDHINRNKMDNRRSNLRIADKSLNGANTGIRKDNVVTGHKNIKYDKRYRHYAVRVTKNGVTHYGGAYKHLYDAINAANEKRINLFGEFAYIDNYIEPLIGGLSKEMEVSI